VKHFKRSSETFPIDDQYLRNHSSQISLDDFLYCFKQFHSLFSSATEILLSPENSSIFLIFANILDNQFLRFQCIKAYQNQNQIFILSSRFISKFSNNIQKRLNKFNLIVNGNQFKINLDLLCCFSDKFLEMKTHNDVFICSIPDSHFECLKQLMMIFYIASNNSILFFLQQLRFF
jgi:hypothetical protein